MKHGCPYAGDISECVFMAEIFLSKFKMKFVLNGPEDNTL